ncbi:MAG TPA: DUF167 domain-containing protein [Pyrinomonadaceae bacterium]|nr:DUF167 domain-containing protein [Pyrinomonadaceae bacterium]
MISYREEDGSLVFAVRVVPRASRTAAAGEHDGALKVRVAAPPVEGAANGELTRYLAKRLGVSNGSVVIVGGHTSKTKVVKAAGASAEDLLRLAAEG